jgi:hypothetical protein
MNVPYKVLDIAYDIDDEEQEYDLPSNIIIYAPEELKGMELENFLSDKISEYSEQCHLGFSYRSEKVKE